MKYILLTLLIGMIMLSMVSAQDMFRPDQDIYYSKPCLINGTFCDSTAQCNLTWTEPNGSVLINNKPMTNQVSYHNYTITQIGVLGEHSALIVCNQGAESGSQVFPVIINPTGEELSTSQGIIYFIALILGLVLFGLSLYGAIKIPWSDYQDEEGYVVGMNDLKYVKLILWFAVYVLMIWISWLAYNITYGYLTFNVASGFFKMVYFILMYLFYPIGVVFLLTAVIKFIQGKKMKETLQRGLPFR